VECKLDLGLGMGSGTKISVSGMLVVPFWDDYDYAGKNAEIEAICEVSCVLVVEKGWKKKRW
jgi:hypothetical protein